MRKELSELKEIKKTIENKLEHIRNEKDNCDKNTIKALKNDIFQKTSKTFIYNLKKLIQIEGTQKHLARKIGVSEDLLSKYKSGEAFPAIETLIYICEIYKIKIENLISIPLTAIDVENLENNLNIKEDLFEEKYYTYFLVTNIGREGGIHEGIIEILNDNVTFKILSRSGDIVKCFKGNYNTSDKLIYFSLQSAEDGITNITMIKPNVNKNKYTCGLAMLMLPSDANSKPCSQKILFSKIKLDRSLYNHKLKEFLNFSVSENEFGNIKLSREEDEKVYNFIRKLI